MRCLFCREDIVKSLSGVGINVLLHFFILRQFGKAEKSNRKRYDKKKRSDPVVPHCKRKGGARDHAAPKDKEKRHPEELQTEDQQGIKQQSQPSGYVGEGDKG
jgi:hypothetical protein